MSRAFTPPDTLSNDDIRTVADVRRAVWINGIFGLGAGTVTGMVGHIVLQTLQKKYVGEPGAAVSEASHQASRTAGSKTSWIFKCLRPLPPLGRNTFMLSLLGGGALGSFLMSTTAGKNAVHLLHPIFNVGRDEYAGKSAYQIAAIKAQKQDEGGATPNSVNSEDDELDAAHHRARSLQAKASMKRRLETGHSLSDTHGNTWPYDNSEKTEEMQKDRAMHTAEVWGQRQTDRKKVLQDRIEMGNALSNSTGGHWGDGKNIVDDDDKELDAAHHRTRSLQRKSSMKRRLETGHSLSDTHGNKWPYSGPEETAELQRDKAMHRAEMWGQRQTSRKKVLQDKIERGKALSDATGGHWNDGDGGEKQ